MGQLLSAFASVCVPFCLAVSAIAVIALNALAPIQGRRPGGWWQKLRRGVADWGTSSCSIQQQLAAIMASQCVLCVALAVSLEACRCIFAAPPELRIEWKTTLSKNKHIYILKLQIIYKMNHFISKNCALEKAWKTRDTHFCKEKRSNQNIKYRYRSS